ncbi:MAG: hypothetical protein RBS13_06215 [Bacteroidales bacterium]|jgi:hypothetical protein|nr:hypothetical protein [Bacteroidales bacterium]
MWQKFIKNVLFIKIRNGKYRVFFIADLGGLVTIPQKAIAEALSLKYDESTDTIRFANYRNRKRILENAGINAAIKEG